MFPFESFLKKSGKPRCTGLWAWGDNHMRAVELYRESIEASQVWAQGGDHLEGVALVDEELLPLGRVEHFLRVIM